jgi:hypothetical protein
MYDFDLNEGEDNSDVDDETQSNYNLRIRNRSQESLNFDVNRIKHHSPVSSGLKKKNSQVLNVKSRESLNLYNNKTNRSKTPEMKRSQVQFSMETDDVDYNPYLNSKKSNSLVKITKNVPNKGKSVTKKSSAKDFSENFHIHDKNNSRILKETLSLPKSTIKNRPRNKVVSDDDETYEIKAPKLRSTSKETKQVSPMRSKNNKKARKSSKHIVENNDDQLTHVKVNQITKKNNNQNEQGHENEDDGGHEGENSQPKRRGRLPKSVMTSKVSQETRKHLAENDQLTNIKAKQSRKQNQNQNDEDEHENESDKKTKKPRLKVQASKSTVRVKIAPKISPKKAEKQEKVMSVTKRGKSREINEHEFDENNKMPKAKVGIKPTTTQQNNDAKQFNMPARRLRSGRKY